MLYTNATQITAQAMNEIKVRELQDQLEKQIQSDTAYVAKSNLLDQALAEAFSSGKSPQEVIGLLCGELRLVYQSLRAGAETKSRCLLFLQEVLQRELARKASMNPSSAPVPDATESLAPTLGRSQGTQQQSFSQRSVTPTRKTETLEQKVAEARSVSASRTGTQSRHLMVDESEVDVVKDDQIVFAVKPAHLVPVDSLPVGIHTYIGTIYSTVTICLEGKKIASVLIDGDFKHVTHHVCRNRKQFSSGDRIPQELAAALLKEQLNPGYPTVRLL